MEITINVGGPLADAINNLAASLQATGLIDRVQGPRKTVKPKTEPVAPVPAPSETVPSSTAEAPPAPEATVSTAPSITSYEQLRAHVAPLLANPATKLVVTKAIKKFCDGKLQDIKTEDYPALVASLKDIAK